MKTIQTAIVFLSFAALNFVGLSRSANAQVLSELSLPPNGANERAEVSQWIGLVKITIAYHSPNVHGGTGADRTGHIWGDLVRYGFFDEGLGPSRATPWRAGANETTTITVSHDVKVEGKELKAGTYGLFLELEKTGPWVWIFSNNSSGWGSFQYDPKDDVLRIPVNPQAAPYAEFLTYGFDDRRPDSALAFLQWENKRIPFKIEVPNVNDLYVAQIRNDLQGWPGFKYQNWQIAAQFCASHKINLEEALIWADKAIHEPFKGPSRGREDSSTLATKAAVLQAMGRDAEADATIDRALGLPETDVVRMYGYAAGLLSAGRSEKALAIFQSNQQHHPEETFWTYLGLAQGYTAVGDKSNAIKNWEIALLNVPPNAHSDIPTYEKTLKQLKERN
jgi:tetratricopeptide (TPR) repeat protein